MSEKAKQMILYSGIWTQEHPMCQEQVENSVLYSRIWTQEHPICQEKIKMWLAEAWGSRAEIWPGIGWPWPGESAEAEFTTRPLRH